MKTLNLLNEQISKEFYNSNLYQCMAGAFELMNLDGFAKEYRTHSDEERGHGLKIMGYLLDRGFEATTLGNIEACPSFKGKNVLDLAKLTVEAEIKTTASLINIAKVATDEQAHQDYIFLQWFLSEQVEEEDAARKLVGLLEVNTPTATLLLDQEYLED